MEKLSQAMQECLYAIASQEGRPDDGRPDGYRSATYDALISRGLVRYSALSACTYRGYYVVRNAVTKSILDGML